MASSAVLQNAGATAATKLGSRFLQSARTKSWYEICVGLEIHTQVIAQTKLFSGAKADASKSNLDNYLRNNKYELESIGLQNSLLQSSGASFFTTSSPFQFVADTLPTAPSTNASLPLLPSTFQPNSCVSYFDASHPGTMPSINQSAILQSVRTGLVLHCNIQKESIFERKHYTYADLPLGYQITQLSQPIAKNGYMYYQIPGTARRMGTDASYNNKTSKNPYSSSPASIIPRVVRINRVQIEQDSGKAVHELLPSASLIDLNRVGVTLLEIVCEPDLRTSNEAVATLQTLQNLLIHNQISTGAFEAGSLRCDVNVSIRPVDVPYMNEIYELEYHQIQELMKIKYNSTNDKLSLSPQTHRSVWYNDEDCYRGEYMESKHMWKWEWKSTQKGNETESSSNHIPLLNEILSSRSRNFKKFGPRVEMKNLSSLRAVLHGVEYEANRQISLLENNQHIERETRLFDVQSKSSIRLRRKENEADYRFLPEPDLTPILIPSNVLREIQATLPPSIDTLMNRCIRNYGLSFSDTYFLVHQSSGSDYFTATLTKLVEELKKMAVKTKMDTVMIQYPIDGILSPVTKDLAKLVVNWIVNDLAAVLQERNIKSLAFLSVQPNRLGQLLALIYCKQISGRRAKDILQIMLGERINTAVSSNAGKKNASSNSSKKTTLRNDASIDVGSVLTEDIDNINNLDLEESYSKGIVSPNSFTQYLEGDERMPIEIMKEKQWMQINDPQIIAKYGEDVLKDPKTIELIQNWKENGQDRALSSITASILQLSNGLVNPELAGNYVKEILGPLGKRPEGKMSRKEKAKFAAATKDDNNNLAT